MHALFTRFLTRLFSLFLMLTGPTLVTAGAAGGSATGGPTAGAFTFEGIDGKPLALADFAGKVLLVVNTASLCGFTRQYEGLQKLHERYADKGFAVIGVPSNDFGGQEPKAESDIKSFCETTFGVTFPLAAKTVVVGPKAHGFYAWAVAQLGAKAAPRWNFHKYLVGRDGRLVASFGTSVEPDAADLVKAIEAALAAGA